MRGRIGIERCCCDCITCPSCWGDSASRFYWLHVEQASAPTQSGNYRLQYVGNCRWETDDSVLPLHAVLQVTTTTSWVQISHDQDPVVIRWEYVLDVTEDQADCDEWSNATWTCKEDTGTYGCAPGDSFSLQAIYFPAESDQDRNIVTDGDGNRIIGAADNRCFYEINCGSCLNLETPASIRYRVAGAVDGTTNACSVWNGQEFTLRNQELLPDVFPYPNPCEFWLEAEPARPFPQQSHGALEFGIGVPGYAATFSYREWITPTTFQTRQIRFSASDLTDPKDCMNFSDLVLTYDSGGEGADCDWTNATITVNPSN